MLLLFDIDGTLLLGASREHADAMYVALRDVYGVAYQPATRVPAAGRTDLEIARAILLASDVPADRIDDDADEFRAACVQEYARLAPDDLSGCLAPGIADLLDSLAARPGVMLSLVTGNLEPIARLKLARAGIGDHFAVGQGGFGSDSEDRTDLPPIARRRAGAVDGAAVPRERTLVIGDTPLDIACAHADGLRCLAVTTGPYAARELAAAAADAVATDATELRALLEAELSL